MSKHRKLPSWEILNEHFEYCDGELYWKKYPCNNSRRRAGDLAGSLGTRGYRQVSFMGQTWKVARVIYKLVNQKDPGEFEVDHINNNRLDDRVDNLRLATRAQNLRNIGIKATNTHKYKGVKRSGRYWQACITADYTAHYLGSYGTPEEAYAAYCKAAEELHGEFKNLGG